MIQSASKQQALYTKSGLWYLFVMCAFPLHLWTLLLAFRDVSWVTERTNAWDAVGVVSYGLLFALIESILLFLTFTLLGVVIPKYWAPNKRTGFLITLVMILSIWGMIGQLLFLWNINLPWFLIHLIAQSGHPLRYLYMGSLALVIPTVTIPVYIFLKSDKALVRAENIADQLSILTGLYLFLDVLGVIVIVIRNI